MSANSSTRRWLLPMVAMLLTATVWAVRALETMGGHEVAKAGGAD